VATRLGLWGAAVGAVGAVVLVVLFRSTQSPTICRFFVTADALASFAASRATSWFFPGDRVHRIIDIATFYDIVLVLGTGLQCALLGFCAGLLLRRKVTAGTNVKPLP
jgi:hypothetical protein